VSETDNHAESGQAANSGSPQGSGRKWWSSLWLWPAAAIALAGVAGTLFGPIGAVLVGEVLAAVVVTAGILFLSRDRWLTFGLAAALTVSLVVAVGSVWLHESHHEISSRASAGAVAGVPKPPVDWQWQEISQAMANEGNLRGADLDGANLNGLQLSHEDLDGAQANGASFRGSQLEDASLQGASLRGACLQGANLTGANLSGADFTGADVAGVAVSPQATRAALVWPGRHSAPTAACY
jgi:hypothetical protein